MAAPVSRGRPRKHSRLLLRVPPRLRKMCPPGVKTGQLTSHDDPHALSESREALLIHVRELLAAADLDPMSVGPAATEAVAAARRSKDPEILGLSLRVLALSFRARLDDAGARRLLDEAVNGSRRPERHSGGGGESMPRSATSMRRSSPSAARRTSRRRSARAISTRSGSPGP